MRRLGHRTDVDDIRHYEEKFYEPRLWTFAARARALSVSMDVLLYDVACCARPATATWAPITRRARTRPLSSPSPV